MKHIKLFEDYNDNYKTIVILGLPGSGKSHLANKILKENPDMNYVIYDDFEFRECIKKMGTENQILSDGSLLERPMEIWRIKQTGESKGVDVEFMYFENDPEKALHNAKRRWESGEGKSYQKTEDMERSMEPMSMDYSRILPKDVTPLPIFLRP
jgi:GTPase SAR1 family protein